MRSGIEYINTQPHTWLYITSFDGLKLAARYYNNNSDKTIILVHGYRSTSTRDFSTAVKMYMNFGFNVLLCDQRCSGRSEGRIITFGVKEHRDVLSWVDLIKNKYNTENIVLDGISMGATTVLLASEKAPKCVKRIVADCGFTSPVEIIKYVGKKYFKLNATLILPILNLLCLIFGRFSIYNISTIDSLKNSDIPVLFVHGAADDFVPCEMSQRTYDSIIERARIIIVEGAGHGLSYFVDTERVENELKSFLNF